MFYVVLLRWLDHTFLHYSAIPWPLTWLPIVALAAYCGLYLGVVAGAVAWLRGRLGAGPRPGAGAPRSGWWASGCAAGSWAASPGACSATRRHAQLPVIQIAELGGVYAVSFLIVAVNAALAALLALGPRRAWPGAAAALVAARGLARVRPARDRRGRARGRRGSVEVAVIQPSIEQTIKWNPARHAQIMDIYEQLTREAARARPAVVLWPETATTIFLRGDPVAARAAAPAVGGSRHADPGGLDRPPGTDPGSSS